MQKYVIVQLLEYVQDGTQFAMENWPLHITIAGNFVLNQNVDEIIEIIQKFASIRRSFIAKAGEDDYFGSQHQVHVTKLDMNEALLRLHEDLIELLKSNGAIFDDPQYTGDGYIAHATVQYEKRLNKGDEVIFNSLTLVDMFPGGDIKQRKVLRTIKF